MAIRIGKVHKRRTVKAGVICPCLFSLRHSVYARTPSVATAHSSFSGQQAESAVYSVRPRSLPLNRDVIEGRLVVKHISLSNCVCPLLFDSLRQFRRGMSSIEVLGHILESVERDDAMLNLSLL